MGLYTDMHMIIRTMYSNYYATECMYSNTVVAYAHHKCVPPTRQYRHTDLDGHTVLHSDMEDDTPLQIKMIAVALNSNYC